MTNSKLNHLGAQGTFKYALSLTWQLLSGLGGRAQERTPEAAQGSPFLLIRIN